MQAPLVSTWLPASLPHHSLFSRSLVTAYAEKTRFGARIVHGMLSASLFSGILGSQIPGNPFNTIIITKPR
jgi:hypothetical protein